MNFYQNNPQLSARISASLSLDYSGWFLSTDLLYLHLPTFPSFHFFLRARVR